MASYVPPIKNGASGWIGYVSLAPRAASGIWQANPTLATGDVKVSLDGGALANLGTLPAVTPASSKLVKITLSQAEVNADNVAIIFSDASGAEWCDLTINLQTVARQMDDLAFPVTSGRGIDVDTSGGVEVGSFQTGAITAAAIASDAITDAKVASDVTIASVTGAVGSVTGNVGGNVTGSVGSVATGGIVAASIAADAFTAAKFAADVTTEFQAGLATAAALTVVDDFLDTEVAAILAAVDTEIAAIITTLGTPAGVSISADIAAVEAQTDDIGTAGAGLTAIPWNAAWDAEVQSEVADALAVYDPPTGAELVSEINAVQSDIAALTIPTAAAVADAVWDEAIAGHAGAGSTGEQLSAAGSAGDPWATALPGAYSSGQAGKIVGDNLNATVSSRASQTSVDTVDDFLDTEVAAIKAKTDNLPSDPADASVIAGRFDTLDTSVADLPTNAELATALGTADDSALAQIALVKAQTDKLTFGVTNVLNSNVTHVNEIAVDGAGTTLDPWGPV